MPSVPASAENLTAAALADDPFGEDFMARLGRLRLLVRGIFQGVYAAERRSHGVGSSLDFADYRNYTSGDDLRMIDWNIYGRLGKLFVKLHENEQDIATHILVDMSASMAWDPGADFLGAVPKTRRETVGTSSADQRKLRYALRAAAALGYVALSRQDHVTLWPYAATIGKGSGPWRGVSRFNRLLQDARGFPAPGAGEGSLARAVRDFLKTGPRVGLAIVVTDGLEPGGIAEALRLLQTRRFATAILHVLHPWELDPPLDGMLRLHEDEGGQHRDVLVTETERRSYQLQMNEFCRGMETECRRRGAVYARTSTAVPFEDFILRVLREQNLLR
jgi:uncharacterized protein (DUF58 family)